MEVYSVSDFVHGLNEMLSGIPACVQGEVSNFKITQNKFVWFELKDDKSYISCFLLAFQLEAPLTDGMEVQIIGRPGLFAKSGKFHLRVNKIQVVGEGSLKRQYELLKAKLTTEGLFDSARKRQLPRFPQNIGLVTSADAAAYTDVLRILKNRWAGLTITHFPVPVQGDTAAPNIVKALQYINAQYSKTLDVVILTRGGGSMEDLQAFNDEAVVRTVFALQVPCVAAIGHERDETLVESAADVRASTPSNAAEMVVPDKVDLLRQLQVLVSRQEQSLVTQHHIVEERVSSAITLLDQQLGHYQQKVAHKLELLQSYNPNSILQRGYSITQTKAGAVVTSATQLQTGQEISTTFVDGKVASQVV